MMPDLSPADLLSQLRSYASNLPSSLAEDADLRMQLFYAARDAMISFEDNPNPISRVAVAQVRHK